MRTLLILNLVLFSTSGAFAEDVFSKTALQRFADKDPTAIFHDAKLRCHLTALLGATALKGLEENMSQVEIGVPAEANGAYPLKGFVRGLNTIAEGIVLVHPDGRLWVGYLHDGKLDYFSNDKMSVDSPPETLKAWGKFDLPWNVVKVDLAKFSEAVRSCATISSGCDEDSRFERVAVVVGKAKDKARFRGSKAFVVPGDVVRTVATAKGEFVCAAYRGEGKAERYGELSRSQLVGLDGTALNGRVKEPTVPPARWVGKWERGNSASLTLASGKGGTLIAEGNATAGAHTGNIKGQFFTVAGAMASETKDQPQGSEVCANMKLYRFNNALIVDAPNECGGVGVSFSGAYFRAK